MNDISSEVTIIEEPTVAFYRAMVKVQAEIPVIYRDMKNNQTHSQYASYENIVKITKEIYTKQGFSISFSEGDTPRENHIRINATVMHEGGHSVNHFADIPLDVAGIKGTTNKTAVHAKGSSFSYGRRYLLCMIFNIPTGDDDDGQSAGAKYLNEAELKKIDGLIKDLKVNEKKFMKFMKAESTGNILKRDFGKALTALEAKRNQSKGGEKK